MNTAHRDSSLLSVSCNLSSYFVMLSNTFYLLGRFRFFFYRFAHFLESFLTCTIYHHFQLNCQYRVEERCTKYEFECALCEYSFSRLVYVENLYTHKTESYIHTRTRECYSFAAGMLFSFVERSLPHCTFARCCFACSQNSSHRFARSRTLPPRKLLIIVCHVSQNSCKPFAYRKSLLNTFIVSRDSS